MMMACPLSAILNHKNKSPKGKRKRPNDESGDEEKDLRNPNPTKRITIRPKPSAHTSLAHSISDSDQHQEEATRIYRTCDSVNRLLTPTQSFPSSRMESEPPCSELDFGQFSIFKALLNHAELIFELSKHLDVEELVSLYAISKDFHALVNSRFTHMIRLQAKIKAPESSGIFAFHCYQPLCQRDPAARPLERLPEEVRWVPTFRWLRMILFRDQVVEEIIQCLSAEGHFMPRRASLTIKKIWFTIDIGNNRYRIGLSHNRHFWTDQDLYLATLFFIKLDLRFTHPVTGNGEVGLRKMLLGQRSLSTLLSVLKRQQLLSQAELMHMIVEFDYHPTELEQESRGRLLDVPPHKIGRLSREGWGMTTEKFHPVDELVMREAIRRKLNIHEHYMDMILYGYVDKTTFEDAWHMEGQTNDDEVDFTADMRGGD